LHQRVAQIATLSRGQTRLVVFLSCCLIAACGSNGVLPSDLPEGACRTTADCGGRRCIMPWDCPAPAQNPNKCGDHSCWEDYYCFEYASICGNFQMGSECLPVCTTDSDCSTDLAYEISGETSLVPGPGFVCLDGACEPLECNNGYTCPAHLTCLAGSRRDIHGCGFKSCANESACPEEEYCVEGYCLAQPGVCGSDPNWRNPTADSSAQLDEPDA
jgi:hypothetical protein